MIRIVTTTVLVIFYYYHWYLEGGGGGGVGYSSKFYTGRLCLDVQSLILL